MLIYPLSSQTISDILGTQAFREKFPASEFASGLEGFVDYHINFVQEVVQRLVSNPVKDLFI